MLVQILPRFSLFLLDCQVQANRPHLLHFQHKLRHLFSDSLCSGFRQLLPIVSRVGYLWVDFNFQDLLGYFWLLDFFRGDNPANPGGFLAASRHCPSQFFVYPE